MGLNLKVIIAGVLDGIIKYIKSSTTNNI